jgi:hypothetical protein
MIKLEDIRSFTTSEPSEGGPGQRAARPTLRIYQHQPAQSEKAQTPYKEFSPSELTDEQCAELNRAAPPMSALRILTETAWDD